MFEFEWDDALRRGVAEFVGAFTLIFVGAGAAVAANQAHDPTLIGVAVANGIAIGVMVSAVGHISGGHFNPAITVGFLVTRRIKPALAVLYWVAQFGGAALAALLVRDLLPRAASQAVNLGVPALGHGVDASSGFLLEAVLTFFLVWLVFATAVDPRGTFKSIAGLAIGLTITIDVLFGGPFTGAAMNQREPSGRSWWATTGLTRGCGTPGRYSARSWRSRCTSCCTCARAVPSPSAHRRAGSTSPVPASPHRMGA